MEIYGFYKGERKSLTQLAAESGVSYDTLLARYKAGVPFGELVDISEDAKSAGGSAVRNLLDNSDFANPVNQRGKTTYTTAGIAYAIDRWQNQCGTLTVHDGYVNWTSDGSANYKRLIQKLGVKFAAGKTYTIAMFARVNAVSGGAQMRFANNYSPVSGAVSKYITKTTSDFEWFICSHTFTEDIAIPGFDILITNTTVSILDIDIKYAAIYEGKYTVETLPEYQPKGYGAELLECQRYLYRLSASGVMMTGGNAGGQYSYFYLPLPVALQGTGVPTLEHSGVDIYPFKTGGAVEITAFSTGILSSRNGVTLRATHATGVAAERDAMALRIGAGGYLAINMEL